MAQFAFTNLGLYLARNYYDGHANTLLFDLKKGVIERFCPGQGKDNRAMNVLDRQIETLFGLVLPRWKYRGIVDAPTTAIQEITDDKELCVAHACIIVC